MSYKLQISPVQFLMPFYIIKQNLKLTLHSSSNSKASTLLQSQRLFKTMKYLTALLTVATTGVSAASIPGASDSATVILRSVPLDLTTQTGFNGNQPEQKGPVGSSGPFESVELNLAANFGNKALRCQVLASNNQPIVLVRGANVDTTFGDAGKGPWTFKAGATKVNQIKCDPAFKAANQNAPPAPPAAAADTSIRVTLSDGDLATQTAFQKAGLVPEVQNPVASRGPFNSVNLSLGSGVQKKDLRCQVRDERNKPITVKRGANVQNTFADGGLGPWTFVKPASSKVAKIFCDPAFVKA